MLHTYPRDIRNALFAERAKLGITDACATGSRAICPDAVHDESSDWDIVALAASLPEGGEPYAGAKLSMAYFTSLKYPVESGVLNIIVTNNQQFYNQFCLATKVARRLNLQDRTDRVMLFQAMLYGNAPRPGSNG